MEYYHRLIKFRGEHYGCKIKTHIDYVKAVLSIANLILTYKVSDNSSQIGSQYIYINTDRFNRVFVIKQDSINTYIFPFGLKFQTQMDGSQTIQICMNDIDISQQLISKCLSFANAKELAKYQRNSYYVATLDSQIDKNDKIEVDALIVFESLLMIEPGYLRWDYDLKNYNGISHPIYHLDINFSDIATYKIGVDNRLTLNDFKIILDNKEKRWFLHEKTFVNRIVYLIKNSEVVYIFKKEVHALIKSIKKYNYQVLHLLK